MPQVLMIQNFFSFSENSSCFRCPSPYNMRMETLDQIITKAAEHISANRSLLVVAQLKEIMRHAVESAFDSRLHAEMEAQDAWWEEQFERLVDPDDKADPDCPEEF